MSGTEFPLQLFCARCARRLERGKTYYIVTVTLTAEVEEGIPATLTEGELKTLSSQLQNKSQQDLEDEVYQRFQFILCKPCRDVFVRHPLGKEFSYSPTGQT